MATTNFDVIQTVPRVATLIYQTHQLWQEIKNVPDGIMGLVDQLKALESIFSDIEDQFNEDGASPSFKNCLELSKKAHDSLGVLVADMRTQLQANKRMKRKYAAVKILLNKAVLERLEQSLSRCMTFLQLAIQAYQMAMLRKLSSQTTSARFQPQHHAQVQQLLPQRPQKKMPHKQTERDEDLIETENVVARSRKTTDLFTFNFAQYVRFALAHTKSTGAWQAQLQVPKWLSTSVYELMSEPAIAGWTYTYRVYNIIPEDSEIIMKIRDGDVIGVRDMFSSKKASPFDKGQGGESLLYYAASSRQYEICQLLLKLGLQSLLDTRGRFNSPLERIASDMARTKLQKLTWTAEEDPQRIAELFASYLQEPDSLPAERLLDFIGEFSPDDTMISNFQSLFMPNYYLRSLRDRLEAVRLGAFNCLGVKTFENLLWRDRIVPSGSVSQSTRERLSLVHSVALALGCRYPEKLVPYEKPRPWLHVYSEGWGNVVTKIASSATLEDLTSMETVVPWDAHEVTAWTGTPLISLIGGTLCYLCPNINYNHWDGLFHGCLRKWLTLLQSAGVDLLEYGKRELAVLRDFDANTKGAFDAEAIETSRTLIRHPMAKGNMKDRIYHVGYKNGQTTWTDRSGEQYWLPFRIISLEVGANPDDWKLSWAFEFEYMACQFWRLIEGQERPMPGSWVDC
ncbi:hypothetical protein CI102_6677 [Trichoderma harzianum]|nr:hypothetical protein CI102_6677 [Trichoderma harzianum]